MRYIYNSLNIVPVVPKIYFCKGPITEFHGCFKFAIFLNVMKVIFVRLIDFRRIHIFWLVIKARIQVNIFEK